MIVLPFLPAILWAVVFAVTIWPFFTRVEKALGGRTSLAAVVPTLLLALIFFLPLVYVGSKLVGQASIAFDYAQGLMEKGLGPPPLWLKGLPLVGERLEGIWQDIGQDTPKLIEMVKPHIKNLLGLNRKCRGRNGPDHSVNDPQSDYFLLPPQGRALPSNRPRNNGRPPGRRKGAPSSFRGRVHNALGGLWDPRRRDCPGNHGDLWPLDIRGPQPRLPGDGGRVVRPRSRLA